MTELKISTLHHHETHRHTAVKFLLLLFVVTGYFGYLSYQYDFSTGVMITAITWSFFVLCTPVADAGFLLDFPIRLLFGIKMLITEIFVWGLAIVINVYGLAFHADSYNHNLLTQVFYEILTHPVPNWSIIILCGVGTFLSIHFGDEILDVTHHDHRQNYHKHKKLYKLLLMALVILLIIWGYGVLIDQMGIEVLG